jgi:hypothetical protein
MSRIPNTAYNAGLGTIKIETKSYRKMRKKKYQDLGGISAACQKNLTHTGKRLFFSLTIVRRLSDTSEDTVRYLLRRQKSVT